MQEKYNLSDLSNRSIELNLQQICSGWKCVLVLFKEKVWVEVVEEKEGFGPRRGATFFSPSSGRLRGYVVDQNICRAVSPNGAEYLSTLLDCTTQKLYRLILGRRKGWIMAGSHVLLETSSSCYNIKCIQLWQRKFFEALVFMFLGD